MAGLEDWMDDNDTDPLITKYVLQALCNWMDDADAPQPRGSPLMRQTMQAQNKLGVWNLLMGMIIHSFEGLQNKHYKKKNSCRSGFRWTKVIIKKLFDVSWDMWGHRNGILHSSPDRHFRANDLGEANQDVDTEWNRGKAGLLTQDHFLF